MNPTLGGPIRQDKLWFFTSWTKNAIENYVANIYHAKDPAAWIYEPDLSRQGVWEKPGWAGSGRLTWQVSPRNKLNLSHEREEHCDCTAAYFVFFRAPEALWIARFHNPMAQVTWL